MLTLHLFLAAALTADPAPKVLVPGSALPFTESVSAGRVEQSVAAGLGFLTETGVVWVRERKCASCHHTPELLWPMHEARNHGLSIDEAALAEVRTASFHADNRGRLFADTGAPEPAKAFSVPGMYLALAELPAAPGDAEVKAMLSRIAADLVTWQQPDGSWKNPMTRPPLADTNEMTTLQCLLALSSPWLADDTAAEAIKTSRDRGLAWLAANPITEAPQHDVFRIMLYQRLGRPIEEIKPFVERILSRQRSDGGWGQTAELASDALATGQSLYALRLAGVDAQSPAIDRGRAYLVNTQEADGSWIMHSRGGNKNLKPIGYVGASWATLGLIRSRIPVAPLAAATR